jgi:hypothetical protein
MAATAPPRAELVTIDGCPPTTFSAVRPPDEDSRKVDEAVLLRARQVAADDPWVGVELKRSLSPKTVLRALQTAHFVKVNVELIGDAPKETLEAPPLFAAAVAAVGELQLAAPVRVLFTDEPCDGCEGSLEGWTLGEVPRAGDFKALPGVEVTWTGDTAALVKASLTALSHQHLLVVRVPPPEPPPLLPDY